MHNESESISSLTLRAAQAGRKGWMRRGLLLALLFSWAQPGLAQQESILYGIGELDQSSALFIVDPDSGETTLIGEVGFSGCRGLDFDNQGRLFALCDDSSRIRASRFSIRSRSMVRLGSSFP